MTWTTYGFLKENPSIWISNISAICFGCYYIWVYSRFVEASDRSGLMNQLMGAACLIAVVGLCAVILPLVTAIQYIGMIGTGIVVVMFSGPLAAIKTVVRERSTQSIPPVFAVASFVNCLLWLGLGVQLEDPFVWFPNGLGLAAAVVQLGLFGVYGLPRAAPRPEAEMAKV
eukprot:CAMPEP_0113668642 /NCGR_PEP_ID=MMETSP0038_2-20120614/4116_1 /TAXON_ID=2898 /ORGANISM="Cryptomonas paramecium" /LENGTH=170 /DNA_ID=CAMNT_0000584413 /DNA_START=156 /DNA_END=668 /DNA_ORIENTATION=- /assembly_acc=CAM_ASM_000170